MLIGVSGLIGTGKTTLTKQLVAELSSRSAGTWRAQLEPVEDNPYLNDFYADMSRWAFNMQMFLLTHRFRQYRKAIQNTPKDGGVVLDRTFYEDRIFAKLLWEDGVLSERDWATYREHYDTLQESLRYPDVILYLKVSPETALERIQRRGRPAEKFLPLSYLQHLHTGYEAFIQEAKKHTVVITLNWTTFMPVPQVVKVLDLTTETNDAHYL